MKIFQWMRALSCLLCFGFVSSFAAASETRRPPEGGRGAYQTGEAPGDAQFPTPTGPAGAREAPGGATANPEHGAQVGQDVMGQLAEVIQNMRGLVQTIDERGTRIGLENVAESRRNLQLLNQRLEQMEVRMRAEGTSAADQRVALSRMVDELSQTMTNLNEVLEQGAANE